MGGVDEMRVIGDCVGIGPGWTVMTERVDAVMVLYSVIVVVTTMSKNSVKVVVLILMHGRKLSIPQAFGTSALLQSLLIGAVDTFSINSSF